MSGPRVALLGLIATMAISVGMAAPASASSIAALTRAAESVNVVTPSLALIPVAERKCPPFCPPYLRQNEKFHERYDPKQSHFGDAHNGFHKFHRKHHRGPVIYFGWHRDYYDPFFYRPYTYDPYYDWPAYSKRISCGYASKLLRQNGCRNVNPTTARERLTALMSPRGKNATRSR